MLAPEPESTPVETEQPERAVCELRSTLLSKKELAQVAEGLEYGDPGDVDRGISIPITEVGQPEHGFTQLVVVNVFGEPALLIAGKDLAPIVAVDDNARETFTWGKAAKSGSAVGDFRDTLASSEAADLARACLSS